MSDGENIGSEIWAGLASMLVVLPSSIAFGIVVFSPLGAAYAASGAIAGIVGSIAIGIVAPLFGGTRRLVSGPSAPAAAVMSALALQLSQLSLPPEHVLLLISLCSLGAGAMQFIYGLIGGGRLIKYIPYPVGAGYLSGVGLLILVSQLPKLFGISAGVPLSLGLLQPHLWSAQSLTVGATTMGLIFLAPRVTKAVPASIMGIFGGIAAYFAMSVFDHKLLTLAGNPLVIGPIQTAGAQTIRAALGRWRALGGLSLDEVRLLAGPTLTLSILLSFDTLKTSVLVDAFSPSRHDSDKELVGQGLANMVSAAGGGMSGSGQTGATLVNINSGARTNLSSLLEGVLCLAAFLALGRLIAWVPAAALAGLLITVSFRMFDFNVFSLLKQKTTIFDFAVVFVVMVVAVFGSLISASVVGIGMAMLLFIRDQMSTSVIRRKTYGNQCFSKQKRLPSEMKILEAHGDMTVVCELQGSLFFGTTDQLYTELEKDLLTRKYIILDMRRVQSVDFTATHVLEQMESRLAERGGRLLFSDLPDKLPTGLELARYFGQLGLVKGKEHARVFTELDHALAWAENHILEDENVPQHESAPALPLEEIGLLRDLKGDALSALRSCLEEKHFAKGTMVFKHGDAGDELLIIRRGRVRIILPLSATKGHHIATFSRGDSFGEIAFLDGDRRSADAEAISDTDLFVLSRRRFDEASKGAPALSAELFSRLAHVLADRLRRTDIELRALQED
jgi:SulP family sulfate permease